MISRPRRLSREPRGTPTPLRAAICAFGPALLSLFAPPLLGACGDPSSSSAGGAATSGAPTTPTASATEPSPAKAERVADGVDLLKLVLASGVKSRDPVDALASAKPGERVYAHATVRNRTASARRVSVSFRVNGDERTLVDLQVEKSWSWRTWAYVTLRKDDKGELTVHVFDEHGAELGTETIPIR